MTAWMICMSANPPDFPTGSTGTATAAPACGKQLHLLQENLVNFVARDLRLFCINVDDPKDGEAVRSFTKREEISLPILLATGVNIFHRFLFDRRRDLGIPTSFFAESGREDRQGISRRTRSAASAE
jgi:AhpC/TSA family